MASLTSVGSKRRVLGRQMPLATRRAFHRVRVRATANELLKLSPTVIASVFEDRHDSKLPGFCVVQPPGRNFRAGRPRITI